MFDCDYALGTHPTAILFHFCSGRLDFGKFAQIELGLTIWYTLCSILARASFHQFSAHHILVLARLLALPHLGVHAVGGQ